MGPKSFPKWAVKKPSMLKGLASATLAIGHFAPGIRIFKEAMRRISTLSVQIQLMFPAPAAVVSVHHGHTAACDRNEHSNREHGTEHRP